MFYFLGYVILTFIFFILYSKEIILKNKLGSDTWLTIPVLIMIVPYVLTGSIPDRIFKKEEF